MFLALGVPKLVLCSAVFEFGSSCLGADIVLVGQNVVRLHRAFQSIQEDEAGCWSSFSSMVITTGKRDSGVLQYLKSVAFHQWLFGLEVAGGHKSTYQRHFFR